MTNIRAFNSNSKVYILEHSIVLVNCRYDGFDVKYINIRKVDQNPPQISSIVNVFYRHAKTVVGFTH